MYYLSSPLDNFGPEDYFLACKHCQKTEGPIYGSVGIEVVIPEQKEEIDEGSEPKEVEQ